MPINFKTGTIKFHKPTVLNNNMGLPVCFSGVCYPVENITARPNGVDFECRGQIFRDVATWEKGIEFVSK